jgi:SOS-response transcriptional repressor LexA
VNTFVMQVPVAITGVKSIGERLLWARQRRGLSQPGLAKLAGVSQGTIGNIEAGIRQNPRELLAIAAAVGVPAEWLKSGKGPRDLADNLSELQLRRRVPLISWVRAGRIEEINDPFHPGDADEWHDVFDTMPGESAFALRVDGDSMTSPYPGELTFPDGTIIVVDPDRNVEAGAFVVAKDITTQRATFKKLTTDGGRWFLKPLNPAYPTVEIDDPAMLVIGRVIEWRRGGKL